MTGQDWKIKVCSRYTLSLSALRYIIHLQIQNTVDYIQPFHQSPQRCYWRQDNGKNFDDNQLVKETRKKVQYAIHIYSKIQATPRNDFNKKGRTWKTYIQWPSRRRPKKEKWRRLRALTARAKDRESCKLITKSPDARQKSWEKSF